MYPKLPVRWRIHAQNAITSSHSHWVLYVWHSCTHSQLVLMQIQVPHMLYHALLRPRHGTTTRLGHSSQAFRYVGVYTRTVALHRLEAQDILTSRGGFIPAKLSWGDLGLEDILHILLPTLIGG